MLETRDKIKEIGNLLVTCMENSKSVIVEVKEQGNYTSTTIFAEIVVNGILNFSDEETDSSFELNKNKILNITEEDDIDCKRFYIQLKNKITQICICCLK